MVQVCLQYVEALSGLCRNSPVYARAELMPSEDFCHVQHPEEQSWISISEGLGRYVRILQGYSQFIMYGEAVRLLEVNSF